MKRIFLFGVIVGVVGLSLFGYSIWFSKSDVSKAQVSDEEYTKLLERDKNVPQEKIDKAFAEAQKIQDDILAVIAKEKPKFILFRTFAGHLRSDVPGRRGATYNEISWLNTKTKLSLNFSLGFSKEDILPIFRRGLSSISSGEFFEVSNIGDKAILVKNVYANTKSTTVGFHFVKGRAMVSLYLTNHKRKTEKNEKELMEIVRLIEPLIIARANFDD